MLHAPLKKNHLGLNNVANNSLHNGGSNNQSNDRSDQSIDSNSNGHIQLALRLQKDSPCNLRLYIRNQAQHQPSIGDDGILNDECIESKPLDKNLTTDSEPEPMDEK